MGTGGYERIEPVGPDLRRAVFVGAAGLRRTVALRRIEDLDAEARRALALAASVGHPTIAAPLDVLDDGEALHVVSEWVEGVDLEELCEAHAARGEDVPWALVAGIGVRLLEALAAVHGRGLAHGAIRERAVRIGPSGAVRLLGLGEPRPEATPAGDLRAVGRLLERCLAGTEELAVARPDLAPTALAAFARVLDARGAGARVLARALAVPLARTPGALLCFDLADRVAPGSAPAPPESGEVELSSLDLVPASTLDLEPGRASAYDRLSEPGSGVVDDDDIERLSLSDLEVASSEDAGGDAVGGGDDGEDDDGDEYEDEDEDHALGGDEDEDEDDDGEWEYEDEDGEQHDDGEWEYEDDEDEHEHEDRGRAAATADEEPAPGAADLSAPLSPDERISFSNLDRDLEPGTARLSFSDLRPSSDRLSLSDVEVVEDEPEEG